MANPQPDKFTRISNEIIGELIRKKLSGQELQLILFIIRKTYGFNKKEDYISLSQMAKALNTSVVRSSQLINKLQHKKIITLKENIKGGTKKYSFNKDYEEWTTLNKNIHCIKSDRTLNQKRNRHLIKSVSTKDTITKDTNTKENIYRVFGKYKEIFKGIYEPRKLTSKLKTKINARLKEFSEEELILMLQKIREDDFITGKNPNGKVYCTPEYCFRSYEMVEKWLNQKDNKQLDPYQNAKTY